MAPFIVVLGTQIQNIKMRSLNLIIKRYAPKVMTKFDFGQKFHNLKYLEGGFSFIFLEYIINLRATLCE